MDDPALDAAQRGAVDQLRLAMELREGFGLYLLVLDTRRLLEVVLAGQRTEILSPPPADRPRRGRAEELSAALADELEVRLSDPCEGRTLVIDCTAEAPWQADAWLRLFRALNSRRNDIAVRWPSNLVVALHPSLEAGFAAAAPDLWSVRGPGLRARDLLSPVAEPLPARPGPGDLLRASSRLVPFVDRGDELARLVAWRDEGPSGSVLLVHAAGGVGKTRLAMEFCARSRGAGWTAGFLPGDAPLARARGCLGLPGPALVVIDYAEGRRDLLGALLPACLDRRGPPLRILLLSRNAGEWWDGLRADAGLGAALDTAPLALAPLSLEAGSRRGVFTAAWGALAEWLDASPPDELPPLDGSDLGSPLGLQLAALAWLDGRHATDEDALLRIGLSWEERYWSAAGLAPPREVARGLAAVTLVGGAAEDALPDLLAAVAVPSPAGVAKALIAFYGRPGPDGLVVPPLEPDLLGEALVDRTLAGEPDAAAFLASVVGSGALRAVLTVLGRLAHRRPGAARWLEALPDDPSPAFWEAVVDVAVEVGDPMGRVFAGRLAASLAGEQAEQVAERCPFPTVALSELAERAWERAVAWRREDGEGAAALAHGLNNFSSRLGALGRREEALEAIEEAVGLYRALAEQRPDAFRPALAMSLNNLSTHLGALGRREEALEAIEEAVGLYRALAEQRPDAFRRYLAMSLNNLSAHLADLGRREEALEAIEEAVGIYRALAVLRAAARGPRDRDAPRPRRRAAVERRLPTPLAGGAEPPLGRARRAAAGGEPMMGPGDPPSCAMSGAGR